jgi:hypothetical protein
VMFWFVNYASTGDVYHIDNVVLTESDGTTPPPPPPPSGDNLVTNGDFESGQASWMFYTNGSGSFDVSGPSAEGSNAAHLTLNSLGSNMQLFQYNVSLEANTVYRLSFSAYSTGGHDMNVSVQKHGSPYTSYGLSFQQVNLGSGWADYTLEFTSANFSGTVSDARVMFWFVNYASTGDVYHIDNVVLTAASSTTQENNEAGADDQNEIMSGVEAPSLPQTVELFQNYPNPFNPSTEIRFVLPFDGRVKLTVYNVLGEVVQELLNTSKSVGYHQVTWNAINVPAGVYIYRLDVIASDNSQSFTDIKKMLLVK